MNKEYFYVNGKVVIEGQNGNKRLEDYSDNLDEILVQENLIETIEASIKDLEKKNHKLDDAKKKKKYIPWGFIAFFLVVSTIFSLGASYTLKLAGASFYKEIGILLASVYVGSIFIASTITLIERKGFKNRQKYAKGIEKELEYAKKQLVLAKEKLVSLNNEKNNQKENAEFKVIKVNDVEKLKWLKENLQMYFNLGYSNNKTKENQLVLKKKR